MYKHASSPGISEEHLLVSAKRFEDFKAQLIADGMPPPVGIGVLIFDEVKVHKLTQHAHTSQVESYYCL